MELIVGRLRAALVAGKIPITDEAVAMLRGGLTTIRHGYHIERAIGERSKTDTELKSDLSRLNAACRTVVDILATDLGGLGQIEAMLTDTWRGSQVPQIVEELRSLCSRVEIALALVTQNGLVKKRRQYPETWFFLAVHDLYSEITGTDQPGIAGPLHRFTKSCAELVDPNIVVPKGENAFRKRLTFALAGRTGKISVFPKTIFPGK
jgi:hypothetical protein